jgi:Flp pilus assembly protein TadG
MYKFLYFNSQLKNKKGATAIMVAFLLLFVIVPLAALAIDLGHLYLVKNELQNAADAGALAGARALYFDDGSAVNTGANEIAKNGAISNISENVAVVVKNWSANTGADDEDVQRGHWSFGRGPILDKGFYLDATNNTATDPIILAGVTDAELDDNKLFINAVKVRARRETPSVIMFFARIFGIAEKILTAEAVAYRGFAGKFEPGTFDQPVAICIEGIGDTNENGQIDGNEKLECNIGRMLNSSGNDATNNTGGWTSFAQEDADGINDPCQGGTNSNELSGIVCNVGNPTVVFQKDIATTGGVNQSVLTSLRNCWMAPGNTSKVQTGEDINGDPIFADRPIDQYEPNPDYDPLLPTDPITNSPIRSGTDGIPDQPWDQTLPVITCPSPNVGTCELLVGAVEVSIVWITSPGIGQLETPEIMYDPDKDIDLFPDPSNGLEGWWIRPPGLTHEDAWTQVPPVNDGFAHSFGLLNKDGSPAPLDNKSLYFKPTCDVVTPTGGTGGDNLGVLAEEPVLVR